MSGARKKLPRLIFVSDTEAKSYSNRNPEDVLESCADEKRRKYSEACHEKHIAFTPLIFSVDGMMAREQNFSQKTGGQTRY